MKIGILTFHCAHNYGAVLQCYGLQEYLKGLGHDVYVIDYRPKYLTSDRNYVKFSPKILITRHLKLFPKVFYAGIKLRKYRNRKWKKFEEFISQKLNLYKTENFDGEGFDLCVVGSDQVWNKGLTGGRFEPLYFGVGFKCPVVSYAASTIVDNYSEEEKKTLSVLLKNFTAISVREEKLKNQLREFTDMNTTVVIDPTLLAGRYPFERMLSGTTVAKEKYILDYVIRENPAVHRIAKQIAEENGLKVIEISSGFSLSRYQNKVYDAGVEEFVALFKNAEFIVTNSFHGTAFSIIFHKDFYSVRHNSSADDRIANLLHSLNLENRLIQPDSNPMRSTVDYSTVKMNIDKVVKDSENFVIRALNT